MKAKRLVLAAPLALLAAGCAIHDPAAEARYDASLARWKGQPESALLAQWGTPVARFDQGDVRTLTFVVRDGIGPDNGAGTAIVRGAAPANKMTALGPGMSGGAVTVPAAPLTCTTRFVLRQGVVESWTFEGVGCVVPE